MRIDRASREINATVDQVFRALTEQAAVETWLPPEGARGVIDAFDPTPGGAFRMTLIFAAPGGSGVGKTTENTDVISGEFVDVAPNHLVRQRFTFQSDDPAFAGTMTMTWTLAPGSSGTTVTVTAEDVPDGIRPDDHEAGMRSSLENLANYLHD